MSSVVKTVFGGVDDSAQKGQRRANKQTADFVKEQSAIARGDALALGAAGEQNRNLGFQGALDIFAQSIPQQFSTFQQGNVGAQQALLAGLPQIQNALLGAPTTFQGLQPQTLNFNTDFSQQQLPQFTGIQQALAPKTPEGQFGFESLPPELQALLSQLSPTGQRDLGGLN